MLYIKQVKFKKPIFLAIITSICLVFILAQPALADVGMNIRYPTYDLAQGENLFYGYMTNGDDGSFMLLQSPVDTNRFRVTKGGDIHAYSICNEDGNNCRNLSDVWSSGADGYIGDAQAHTARGTLNMNGNAIYGYLLGAVSGAPDKTIWGISGDYTNWGIFYNEGSPDYIEFKTNGTVSSRIALDTGAADFGLVAGGDVSVGGDLTVSGGAIRTPGGLRLLPTGGYVEAKSNSSAYGLIIRDYNSGSWGNIDANDGYLAIGYNNANGPLFINDYDNIGINTAARTDTYKLAISGSVHMNNNPVNYASQFHFNPQVWFTDNNNNQYLTYRWGNAGYGGIRFLDGDYVLQGAIYGDGNTDPAFGFLDGDSTGGDNNWSIKIVEDTSVQFYVNNSEKMRITSGNVGIGVTNPGYSLTVNNTIGTPDSNNPYLVLDSTDAGTAQVSLGESARGSASLHLSYIGNGYSYIGMGNLGGDNIPDYYAMRMYYTNRDIYMPGNIGIGTLPNSSYKLYVVGGSARINGVIYIGASGGGTAYIDGCDTCRVGGVVYAPNFRAYNAVYIRGGDENGIYVQNNGGADIDGEVEIMGNLGIGTSDMSTYRIYARDSRTGWAYRFWNSTNNSGMYIANGGGDAVSRGLRVYGGSNCDDGDYAFQVYAAGVYRLRVMGNGNVAIGYNLLTPSEKLHVSGDFLMTGNMDSNSLGAYNIRGEWAICGYASREIMGCGSDERLKENIETIDNPVEKLKKLRGVYFNWKKGDDELHDFGNGKDIGLIAQEVEEILPEVIGEDPDGYKTMDYSKLTSFLIEVNKNQQKRIDELKERIERLKMY